MEGSENKKNNYSDSSYWNSRYQQTNTLFDWYLDVDRLKPLLDIYCPLPTNNPTILNLGCGNSELCADLWKHGYSHITNIDISDVIIEHMRKRYTESEMGRAPCVRWLAMDAQDLSFENDSFDLIIEKGTVDALVCRDNSDEVLFHIFSESFRVLKPGGCLLLVTHSAPRERLDLLDSEAFPFELSWHKIAYSLSALVIRELRRLLNGMFLLHDLSDYNQLKFIRQATGRGIQGDVHIRHHAGQGLLSFPSPLLIFITLIRPRCGE
jgi:ubiquinone/menaquinone biosynthesis C-methylase UbiE